MLNRGREKAALYTLLQAGRKLKLPISVLLFLRVVQRKVQKLWGWVITDFFEFNDFISVLTRFGYPEAWVRYLVNRTRIPSFFMAQASTNLPITKHGTVLDLGCGVGHLLPVLAQKFKPAQVIGVDNSFLSLFLARFFFASPASLLICADLEGKLPLQSLVMSLTTSTDTFHYIKHKQRLLQEIGRITRDDGIVSLLHNFPTKVSGLHPIRGQPALKIRKLMGNAGFRYTVLIRNDEFWQKLKAGRDFILGDYIYKVRGPAAVYSVVGSKTPKKIILKLTRAQWRHLQKTQIEYGQDNYLQTVTGLKSIVANFDTFIFVSPHLDDCIFSCEMLIRHLVRAGKRVLFVTVFTRGSPRPYSVTAQKLLDICGYQEAQKFFCDRRREDHRAVGELGCRYIHLSYIDAAWRKTRTFYKHRQLAPVARFLPALIHVYPNAKLQFSGIVSKSDSLLKRSLRKELQSIIGSNLNTLLLAPLGIGGHVDHILVHDVCRSIGRDMIYWEDYPYNLHQDNLTKFENPVAAKLIFSLKRHNIRAAYEYKTFAKQWQALFNLPMSFTGAERYFAETNQKWTAPDQQKTQ